MSTLYLTFAGVTTPCSGAVRSLAGRHGLRDKRSGKDRPNLFVNGKRISGDFELCLVTEPFQVDDSGPWRLIAPSVLPADPALTITATCEPCWS